MYRCVSYLSHAWEYYGAILSYRPDFMFVASGMQPTALDRSMRWMARAHGETDRARVVLTGNSRSGEPADQWQWPGELRLCPSPGGLRIAAVWLGTTSGLQRRYPAGVPCPHPACAFRARLLRGFGLFRTI